MGNNSYNVSVKPELQSIKKFPPNIGQHVLALSIGGRLIETVWGKSSGTFFVATMPFPKVPEDVREELWARYIGKDK